VVKQGHMKADCSSLVNKEKTNEKRLTKLEKGEEHILYGKTMPLLPAAPHMKMLKPICV